MYLILCVSNCVIQKLNYAAYAWDGLQSDRKKEINLFMYVTKFTLKYASTFKKKHFMPQIN